VRKFSHYVRLAFHSISRSQGKDSNYFRISNQSAGFRGIGNSVFTQCVVGVHADGDNKNDLYCSALLPAVDCGAHS
jgi:hypothetical protein